MKLSIVTPLGPGHEPYVDVCCGSVSAAINAAVGTFDDFAHRVVDDTRGQLGRSAARNRGMEIDNDADWYFFIDADDEMTSDAISLFWPHRDEFDAVFGSIWIKRTHRVNFGKTLYGKLNKDRPIENWDDIFHDHIVGTLAMGAFFRGAIARTIWFDEHIDDGEDWDFYLSFLAVSRFIKVNEPLCVINRTIPSAIGPRSGAKSGPHRGDVVRQYWKLRGRRPLMPDEILRRRVR